MNKEQLQEAFDSMTARCATLQNKVFSLQSEVAVLGYEKKYCTICEQCGRKCRNLSCPEIPDNSSEIPKSSDHIIVER